MIVITTADTGGTAWMLVCAALVFLMIPGLVLFYGGASRKTDISLLLKRCFLAASLVTLQWILMGYSLSFGPDHGGWIGTLAWVGLRNVGLEPNLEYAGTIPHQAFMIYHAMVALIAPAVILGAFAERMKFGAYCLFILLWSTLIYDPVAHWVWGVGGFLRNSGAVDFAGGLVVHVTAGVTALLIGLVLGKRQSNSSQSPPPQNFLYALLGAMILWTGWFGLSAGSALSSGSLAASAFVMTYTSAAASSLTWTLLERILRKRPTLLGMFSGTVAGLVAITPAAGFVSVWGAICIGVGASLISYSVLAFLKHKFGYDDSLDVFGVQGLGGMWGAIATGLWATKAVNENGANGLFYGYPAQLLIQIRATLAIIIYSCLMSWALLKLVHWVVGLRVTDTVSTAKTID